ncbi:MAG TPA: hypothetical protein VL283_01615 [Candidatus Baltobacteraceae bacterium]|nr:hypothetical protein [Candidatus Baltobacteraceae bacterium]
MSNGKRSRSSAHVLPLDAGKKDHTTAKPTPPVPTPLIHGLKVKIAVDDARGGCHMSWVEVANYPAEGGLEAFYRLIHQAPDDSFMTADAQGSVSFASIVAIRRPKDEGEEFPVKIAASARGAPKRLYARLRTRIGLGRGEIVEVANVPWTEDGIAHFGWLAGKHRRCEFVTTDFGFMPLRGVKLEDLKMPGAEPERRIERLKPEDILRPEDFPE